MPPHPRAAREIVRDAGLLKTLARRSPCRLAVPVRRYSLRCQTLKHCSTPIAGCSERGSNPPLPLFEGQHSTSCQNARWLL